MSRGKQLHFDWFEAVNFDREIILFVLRKLVDEVKSRNAAKQD